MTDDRNYFRKREMQERSAAASAKGKARDAHAAMADRYHDLAGAESSESNDNYPAGESPETPR